jgi:uncharacterized Zn-binding protein involved in type VI secretion
MVYASQPVGLWPAEPSSLFRGLDMGESLGVSCLLMVTIGKPQGRLNDMAAFKQHRKAGPATSGSANVRVNGRPALREHDIGVHEVSHASEHWSGTGGAPHVLINNRRALRLGDHVKSTTHGHGKVISGSNNVSVGSLGGKSHVAPDIRAIKKDVVVVAWINPDDVALSSVDVDASLIELFPEDGKSFGMHTLDIGTFDTLSYLDSLSGGIDRLPYSASWDSPARYLTRTERTYVLHWMFKYGGNRLAPPEVFANEDELEQFVEDPTRYKLLNRLTVVFFGNVVVDCKKNVRIGTTLLPLKTFPVLGANKMPGEPVSGNDEIDISAGRIRLTNLGNPDRRSVGVFNTLMRDIERKWFPIGSSIFQSTSDINDDVVATENYPTYYVYKRIVPAGTDGPFRLVDRHRQRANPEDHTIGSRVDIDTK